MTCKLALSMADVARAYIALKRQRRQPTLLNLRLELGRGSYSTIAVFLERLQFVGEHGDRYRRRRERVRGRPPGNREKPGNTLGVLSNLPSD